MSEPTHVGTYEFRQLLGTGGIGQVHAAIDTVLQREVAIKSLRPELTRDKAFVERFKAEAINLAKLNHPNIATLFAFLSENDRFYMVMELVNGRTLEDILVERKSAMTAEEAQAVILQAADGLAYAHEMGVIHRDIKPANLMLTEQGRLKIMDFGIARARGSQRLTRDGSIVGTLTYISPEQLKGSEGGERSDQYSLAVVFYELLTGKPPFAAETDYDLIQAHVTQPPAPPSSLVPSIPPDVESAVMRALAKNPDERFDSLHAFAAAMNAGDIHRNATSVIRNSPSLNKALTSKFLGAIPSLTSETFNPVRLKTAFTKLPIEIRGVALGGIAALLVGIGIVLPPLLRSSPPAPVATMPPLASQPSAVAVPAPSQTTNRNFPVEYAGRTEADPATAQARMIEAEQQRNRQREGVSTATAPARSEAPALPTMEELDRAVGRSNYDSAFQLATKLAASGDSGAQLILGNLYRRGQGTAQSFQEAALWYERSARKGNRLAAYYLGAMYDNGLLAADASLNQKKALEFFQMGAELGHNESLAMLGRYHEDGLGGLAKSPEKAIGFYRKAVELGSENARRRLDFLRK